MIHIETRRRIKAWLPKWWPGNVESLIYAGEDLSWDEAEAMAQDALYGPRVFAVMVHDLDSGRVSARGGVRIRIVNQ